MIECSFKQIAPFFVKMTPFLDGAVFRVAFWSCMAFSGKEGVIGATESGESIPRDWWEAFTGDEEGEEEEKEEEVEEEENERLKKRNGISEEGDEEGPRSYTNEIQLKEQW